MEHRLAFAALISVVIAMPWPALAEENVDCSKAETPPELQYCATMAYEAADKELNMLWPKVKAAAQADDRDMGNDSISAGLLASQRAWLSYLNAECELERRYWNGGSGEGTAVDQCKARLTQQRNGILKQRLPQ